jgi:hypothetical protein
MTSAASPSAHFVSHRTISAVSSGTSSRATTSLPRAFAQATIASPDVSARSPR